MPGPANLGFSDVACPAAGVCFAVGTDDEGDAATAPVIERWNGRRWSLLHPRTVPSVRKDDVLMWSAASCPSRRTCVAAWSWFGPDGEQAVTERLRRGKWSFLGSPAPPASSRAMTRLPPAPR
jgi:hypothetical protein